MADECARCVRWDMVSRICHEPDSSFTGQRTMSDAACDQITKGDPMSKDWAHADIVVGYQYNFNLYLRRVKVTKVTKKSVYVEFKDPTYCDTPIMRLSKDKLEYQHGHLFSVRWIRFRLFSKLRCAMQERMKDRKAIQL